MRESRSPPSSESPSMANAREGLLVFSHGGPCVVPWGFLRCSMGLLAFSHEASYIIPWGSLRYFMRASCVFPLCFLRCSTPVSCIVIDSVSALSLFNECMSEIHTNLSSVDAHIYFLYLPHSILRPIFHLFDVAKLA